MTRRTDIRNAFAAAITGLATAGAKVFVSRSLPLGAANLPAILVYSDESRPEGAYVKNGRPVMTRWRLRVEVCVKDSVGAEAVADQILEEIGAALFASSSSMTLGGQVSALSYEGTSPAELDESTDKPVVRVTAIFELIYTA